jgi:hypothetical protein
LTCVGERRRRSQLVSRDTEGGEMGDERYRTHELLLKRVKQLPGDYKPWGEVEREDPRAPGGWWADCSGTCRHYFQLQDVRDEQISYDWGVCTNPESHRCGLLTFEHQGCPKFEYDEEEGARIEAEFEANRAEFMARRAAREVGLSFEDEGRQTFYAEAGEELEIWLLGLDVVALSKGRREHGPSLEWPWIQLTEKELRGLLAEGAALEAT